MLWPILAGWLTGSTVSPVAYLLLQCNTLHAHTPELERRLCQFTEGWAMVACSAICGD